VFFFPVNAYLVKEGVMKQVLIAIVMLITAGFIQAEDEVTYETLTLYATKDVMLRSGRPTVNFNGKTEAMKGYGYGIKRAVKGGKITYPIMILEENKTVIAPHNSFVIGGFDYSELLMKVADPIPKPTMSKVVSVKLRFFVNYAPRPLNKMGIYVCRCNKDWDEKKLVYNDMYKTLDPEEYGAHVARKTHLKELFTCTDENTITIKSNKHQVSRELPFKNAPGFVELDVTSLFVNDIQEGIVNYGFLIFITSIDFPDYTAVDKKGNPVSTGDIEIACTEWFTWDGKVPSGFTGKWLGVTNKAKGKKQYIPHLIIKLENRPNPVYEEYMKALEEQGEEDHPEEYIGPDEI
jgi:hypothetical protein